MKSQLLYLLGGILLGAVGTAYFSLVATSPRNELGSLPTPYYAILFENDHVRVVEHQLKPDESEPMHEHPPMFVYFMEDAHIRILGPDGSSLEESLAKGMTIEAPKPVHAIDNLGSTSLGFVSR